MVYLGILSCFHGQTSLEKGRVPTKPHVSLLRIKLHYIVVTFVLKKVLLKNLKPRTFFTSGLAKVGFYLCVYTYKLLQPTAGLQYLRMDFLEDRTRNDEANQVHLVDLHWQTSIVIL